MNRMMKKFLSQARRLRQREDGNSTIEFAILFPLLVTMFLSAFEIGILMTRNVMLDRAVDLTVRELRLGKMTNPTQDDLRQAICDRASVVPRCMQSLLIELRPVSTVTWSPLGSDTVCKNRDSEIQLPGDMPSAGNSHEMMLVRVCAVFKPVFPSTKIALSLQNDAIGGYALVASSAFVNEPR